LKTEPKNGQRFLERLAKSRRAPSEPDSITRIIRAELGMELAGGVPSLEALSGLPVQEIVQEVEKLLQGVTNIRERSVSARRTEPSNSGDLPLNELITWLGHAWFVVFEKVPGSSVDKEDGTVGGPFIRFVRAALEPLLEEMPTNNALRLRVRRVLPSFR
jgi:hypothetical protein